MRTGAADGLIESEVDANKEVVIDE
jgi:hypothetical protein